MNRGVQGIRHMSHHRAVKHINQSKAGGREKNQKAKALPDSWHPEAWLLLSSLQLQVEVFGDTDVYPEDAMAVHLQWIHQ